MDGSRRSVDIRCVFRMVCARPVCRCSAVTHHHSAVHFVLETDGAISLSTSLRFERKELTSMAFPLKTLPPGCSMKLADTKSIVVHRRKAFWIGQFPSGGMVFGNFAELLVRARRSRAPT